MEQKKRGRKTDDPKPNKVTFKMNDVTLQTLDDYCKRHNKCRSEAIRDGIELLKDK